MSLRILCCSLKRSLPAVAGVFVREFSDKTPYDVFQKFVVVSPGKPNVVYYRDLSKGIVDLTEEEPSEGVSSTDFSKIKRTQITLALMSLLKLKGDLDISDLENRAREGTLSQDEFRLEVISSVAKQKSKEILDNLDKEECSRCLTEIDVRRIHQLSGEYFRILVNE
jgi:hypothetical protein